MILRIFRSNSPLVLFLFLILAFVLWLPGFTSQSMNVFSFNTSQMPLYHLVYEWLQNHTFLRVFIPFLILMIQAFFILKINREYIIVQKQNYLPVLIFILIASSFIELQQVNPGIFSSFFVILMLDQLFACYRKPYVLNRLFVAGLFVGIASLFYIYAAFYLLAIWVALFLLRSMNFREWFVPLLGLIFPYLFVAGYYYISDQLTLVTLSETIRANIFQEVGITYYHVSYYLFYGYLGLMIFMASISLINRFPGRKIYIRKFYEIFWWIFIGPVVLLVLRNQVSVEMLYFIAIPLTYLITDYLSALKNRSWGNLLFVLLFGGLAYILVNHF